MPESPAGPGHHEGLQMISVIGCRPLMDIDKIIWPLPVDFVNLHYGGPAMTKPFYQRRSGPGNGATPAIPGVDRSPGCLPGLTRFPRLNIPL
jgi:hypothetical protein